jgi:hypothetical protein
MGFVTPVSGGGGGSRDGAIDEGLPDGGSLGSVSVTGTLFVVPVLPIATMGPSAPQPAGGWQVESPNSPDAGVVTTSDVGGFAISDIAVVDGAYRLRATPPPGGGTLRSVAELTPTTGRERVNVVAVPSATLESAASTAGVTVDSSAAHLVVQIRGAAVNGVSAALSDTSGRALTANVVYDDDRGGFSTVSGATASRGEILALNVPASAAGTTVYYRLARGTASAEYRFTAYMGHVTFVQAPAP